MNYNPKLHLQSCLIGASTFYDTYCCTLQQIYGFGLDGDGDMFENMKPALTSFLSPP